MGRTCLACRHPERAAIEKAIAEGQPERAISQRYSVSHHSVRNHARCMVTLVKASEVDRQATALSALDHATWLVSKLRALAETVEARGDQFLVVADRLEKCIRTYGMLTGEISTNPIIALYSTLGVSGEGELKAAVAVYRSGEGMGLEECRDEALDLLKVVLAERPEWRQDVLRTLGHVSEAVEVQDHTNGGAENGQQVEA